jgi:hypothetical protein
VRTSSRKLVVVVVVVVMMMITTTTITILITYRLDYRGIVFRFSTRPRDFSS